MNQTVPDKFWPNQEAIGKRFDFFGDTFATEVVGLIDRSLWAARMGAGLVAVFGILALGLSAIGLYGVVAYTVAQRTSAWHSDGVGGAAGGCVLDGDPAGASVLVGSGVAIGLSAAFGLGRLIENVLFGVSPADCARSR